MKKYVLISTTNMDSKVIAKAHSYAKLERMLFSLCKDINGLINFHRMTTNYYTNVPGKVYCIVRV